MQKFKIIGFVFIIILMTIGMFVKITNQEQKEKTWINVLKTKNIETLSFNFIQEKTYTQYHRHFFPTQTKSIFLTLTDSSGIERVFRLNNTYSFLDKSEINLTYVILFNKKCPLKLEANFQGNRYSLKDWGEAPPIEDLNFYAESYCF